MPNPVSPPYYTRTPLQPWDVIDAWDLCYYLGNVLNYIGRAGHKGGPDDEIQDLEKAIHFIQRKISILRERRGADRVGQDATDVARIQLPDVLGAPGSSPGGTEGPADADSGREQGDGRGDAPLRDLTLRIYPE